MARQTELADQPALAVGDENATLDAFGVDMGVDQIGQLVERSRVAPECLDGVHVVPGRVEQVGDGSQERPAFMDAGDEHDGRLARAGVTEGHRFEGPAPPGPQQPKGVRVVASPDGQAGANRERKGGRESNDAMGLPDRPWAR